MEHQREEHDNEVNGSSSINRKNLLSALAAIACGVLFTHWIMHYGVIAGIALVVLAIVSIFETSISLLLKITLSVSAVAIYGIGTFGYAWFAWHYLPH